MKEPIREKIKLDNEVPQEIDRRIKETLDSLRQEKKKKLNYKKLISIGLVAICALTSSTIIMATNKGGLNSLLNKLFPTASRVYEEEKIEIAPIEQIEGGESTVPKSINVTDQDITVSINEMAYDGTAFIFKYTIQAENITFPYEHGAVFAPVFYIGEEKIENISSMGSIGRKLNDTLYEGYGTIYFDWTKQVDNMNGTIKIGIKEVLGKRGDWEIDTHIKMSDVYKPPTIYKINELRQIDGLDIEIEELCISPFSNQLNYTIYNAYSKNDDNMKNFEKIRFFVLDERGNCLNYVSTADSSPNKEVDEWYDVHGTMEFLSFDEIPKILTFIPFKNYSYKTTEIEKVMLDQINAKVPINEHFSINIQNMERGVDAITFAYAYEGVFPERMGFVPTFLNQHGEDITIRENYEVVLDPDTGMNYVTYRVDNPEEIIALQIDKNFNCEIIEEAKFSISIQ